MATEYPCPRCNRLTTGSWSEGGLRWAICEDCMAYDRETVQRHHEETIKRSEMADQPRGSIDAKMAAQAEAQWQILEDSYPYTVLVKVGLQTVTLRVMVTRSVIFMRPSSVLRLAGLITDKDRR